GELVSRSLDLLLVVPDAFLGIFDSYGDIEQVLARAIYFEHMAPIFGLAGFAYELVFGTSSGLFVMLNHRMREASLSKQASHFIYNGSLQRAVDFEAVELAFHSLAQARM